MAKINVLPKHLAELIAAGEVVERPASVVKELTENAIDAGASAITVEIRNGGITYIRITDNGCGIEHADVPKAFLSHATSKLKTSDDLNSIYTLGFRGEALASVAAVSHVEMLTRTKDDETGTSYAIDGGEQTRYETAGCPLGTTIVVRDLFYNTPARMKFLKKDVSEANAVADVIDKLALSHPEISFRFIREGKQTLITPGDNKLISVIYSIFGRVFAEGLIETNYELDGIKVEGYICRPVSARPSRAMQYLFLNGRYIRSRSCIASMENAYKNSIMVGKFPSCVLYITVPPHSVDVNVHPAKTEVRFSDERKVSSAVYYAVKSAIASDEQRPQVDVAKVFQKAKQTAVQLQMVEEDVPVKPNLPNKSVKKEKADFWQSMPASQFKKAENVSAVENVNRHAKNAEEPDIISSFRKKQNEQKSIAKAQENQRKAAVSEKKTEEKTEQKPSLNVNRQNKNDEPKAVQAQQKKGPDNEKKVVITEKPIPKPLRLLGEAFKTYIICEYDGKICIIDKHAAHERIIFNKMKENRNQASSQVLLTAVNIALSKAEYNIITQNLDVFAQCGFLIEDFGNGSVVVRECPMLLDGDDVEDTVIEIASNLALNKTDVQSEKIDRIYHTAACKAAIKAGYKNSTAEMKVLAEQVLYNNDVRYCPHGRPVLIEMSQYELEKQFGRIQ